ncbi:hypothetical protein Golomagni_03558 [Golovinomyces magnicellulatus]|nr:hypothetical protein Golomagni_03558 [Golovinomyces magnicellulatus]
MTSTSTGSTPILLAEQHIASDPSHTSSGSLALHVFVSSTATSTLTTQTSDSASVSSKSHLNIVFQSDISFSSSKSSLTIVPILPSFTSQLRASVTVPALTDPAPTVSTNISPIPQDEILLPSRGNSDTDSSAIIGPRLGLVSIIGCVLGSVALTSLFGLMFLLMRKRKRKRGYVNTDLISRPLGPYNYRPPAPKFGQMQSNQSQHKPIPSRMENFFCKLKSKLRGSRVNPLRSKPYKRGKVDLNRGNSQFFNGPTAQYQSDNTPAVNYIPKMLPRDNEMKWSSWNKKDSVYLHIPGRESNAPKQSKDMSERGIQSKDHHHLHSHPSANENEIRAHTKPYPVLLGKARNANLDLRSDSHNTHNLTSLDTTKYEKHPPENFAKPFNQFNFINISPTMTTHSNVIDDMSETDHESYRSREFPGSSSLYRSDSRSLRTPVISGCPSTLSPTLGSNRDSAYSSFSLSINENNDNRRSDPFDLDSPELWRPRVV